MKKLFVWVKSLFTKKDQHKDTRMKIIAVINGIKEAAENPITEVIFKAIIGRSADGVLDSIRKWLPLILKGLNLTQNGFNEGIAIRQSAAKLNKIPKEERAGYYKMIAGELYHAFTGLPIDTAIEEVQRTYHETK